MKHENEPRIFEGRNKKRERERRKGNKNDNKSIIAILINE